jgi:hypothetical protein
LKNGVHSKFTLLTTQQKQYPQTVANKSFEDAVYIIVATLKKLHKKRSHKKLL